MVSYRIAARFGFGAVLLAGLVFAAPANALTAKECHAAFQSAKANGTLNGQSYKAFKAASCDSAAAPASATPAATTPAATTPAAGASAAPAATVPAAPTAKTAAAPVSSGNVVFPTAVSAQYSKLSAGKARMKTCLDQYHANKASGGNGDLKWIQKGGGYYSQCNAKLKG